MKLQKMKSPYKVMIVFDFETGGLNKEVHGIVEIAMVAVDMLTLEVIGTYESIIKPYGMEYTDEARDKCHKITIEQMEEEGKDVDEVIEEILDFVDDHRNGTSKPFLAGHKVIDFDIPLMEILFARRKRKMTQSFNMTKVYDTLIEARLKWPNSEKYNLGHCCKNAGLVLKEAHRAMPDTMATTKLALSFLKSLRGDGGSSSALKERPRVDYEF